MKRLSLLLSTLLVFFLFAVNAQVNYQALNQYLAKARVDFGATGMAVAVVKDGDVVFQNGYGLEDAENPSAKVTTYSAFGIASISKHFTALGISKLVSEGKLNWNDKVKKYLPYFQLNDPVVTNLMTVEDLLCHRSGLITFDGDLLWYGTNYSQEEILKRIKERPLEKEFRSSFGYQNIMFIAAAKVIEKVSGKPYDEYLEENYFEPLGMIETYCSIDDFKPKTKIAYPHINGTKIPLMNYDNSWGAAGINTTTTDMGIWMRFLLNKGSYGDKKVMAPEAVEEIFKPRNFVEPYQFEKDVDVHFKAYGLGLFTMDYAGKKLMQHGGGLPGYISQLAIVPEEDLGIIVLTNDGSSLAYVALYKLLDEFLDRKGKKVNWAEKFLEYEKLKKEGEAKYQEKLIAQVAKKPSHSVESIQLVGNYQDKMYGQAVITQEKRKLILTLKPSAQVFTSVLEPWNKDLYKIKFSDPFLPEGLVKFDIQNGKVNGFIIDLPNPDFHFYKLDFQKQ